MGLNPIGNPDWPKDAADTIERVVGTLRAKTTKPVVTVARGVVYGLLAVFIGAFALIALLIILFRLVQMLWAVPFDHDTSVWLSYVTVGGIFSIIGVFLMTRRYAGDDI